MDLALITDPEIYSQSIPTPSKHTTMSVSPRAVVCHTALVTDHEILTRMHTPQTDALAPLSAKHVQSTTKRALRGAQPLRDDVQEKLNKLNHRGQDVASIDTDVVDAIAGLSTLLTCRHTHGWRE